MNPETMDKHGAGWERGYAHKGVSCRCGFLPKRTKILKNHIERHDPKGLSEWREALWGSVGIGTSNG